MIKLIKKHRSGLPIHNFFFADAGDITGLAPWTIALCKQASGGLKHQLHPIIVDCQPFTTLLSNLNDPIDTLWRRIDKSRASNIRQGERLGLDIAINQIPCEESYRWLERFYQARGLQQPEWEYFRAVAQHCDLWSATMHGELSYVEVVLRDYPHRARTMYGCHNPEQELSGRDRSAITCFLSWQMVQEYQRQGFQWYDWGGIITDPSSPYYGITLFKAAFGGEVREEWDLTLAGTLVRPLLHLTSRRRQNGLDDTEIQ